ncbi:MAG: radical SAM protein, partial [Dehalococcoidales bacterium]|nr:radical SAM protein [Dehalococcoidales bacterium]
MKQSARTTTLALDFLGCKLNQAEIQELGSELAGAGYRLVEPDGKADIYVLNTCTVTHTADRKSRQMLRAARRRNPSARLIAIGCYADRAADDLAGIEGVELVLGNDRKRQLVELLGKAGAGESPEEEKLSSLKTGRTRSFLRVQDGCRNACAYCIVPIVRSRVESVPADRVLAMVKEQISAGYREIVLTGTEIGTYDDNSTDLKALLERVFAETGIDRLRISSLQPPEITPELIRLWQNPRLCPHFHLSLQSGSDAVLKQMKRRYNRG